MRIISLRGIEVGSILEVRSTGLGGAVREIKRHSKVKVPKVSHGVKKLKKRYSKTLRAQGKGQAKQIIRKRKIKTKVEHRLKKYDKYGDRVS
jgi:hypothetical protein